LKPTVLVIDDEKAFRMVAEEALASEGFEVQTAATGAAGLKAWRGEPTDLVILDRHLPDVDGVRLLEAMVREARERQIETLVVMATAYADVASAVEALKIGAHDYLTKPLQLPELVVTVRKALEARRLREQVKALSGREEQEVQGINLGRSPGMRAVVEMVEKVATAPATTVLIQGESGTGKELVANLIHRRTPSRADAPFIEINCASLPENLLESELFGYERGAFTDAKASKRGLFEAADRGTIFLDEIGELTPGTQAKLLKVLESMSFRRLGGTRDLAVDVRVVAATNKDLAAEVQKGTFRLDLFHRLDVFHLRLPPLRERREDILPLADHFLAQFARRMGRGSMQFGDEAKAILSGYAYPGNVRELKNLIERSVILAGGTEVIGPECILLTGAGVAMGGTWPGADAHAPLGTQDSRPNIPVMAPTASAPTSAAGDGFFNIGLCEGGRPATLAELEKAYIERLLTYAEGNRTQVARLLGVSYPTVVKKITDYGIVVRKPTGTTPPGTT
jgi:DNA-binding NtrC family response regulator